MITRARFLLSSPLVQGASGAVLAILVWIAVQPILPQAEANVSGARPPWDTDYLPVTPVIAPVPLRAGFIDLSYVDSHDQATVNHWEWDFGDGSPTLVCFGSQCVPHYRVIYEYSEPGLYDVQLLTGGTHEGTARYASLVRAYSSTAIESDIVGFFLRDGYALLLSPSGEWGDLKAVAQRTGIHAVYVMGDTHVERLSVDAGPDVEALNERLQGLLWAIAEVRPGGQPEVQR